MWSEGGWKREPRRRDEAVEHLAFLRRDGGDKWKLRLHRVCRGIPPFTEPDLENLVRAAGLYGMGTMIKVDFQNRFYTAQRAMGASFQAINFAGHENAAEVEESVRMTMPYTPDDGGRFGYPTRRFIGTASHASQSEHAERVRRWCAAL